METQKGVLESFCYESSKHSMENDLVECLYNDLINL